MLYKSLRKNCVRVNGRHIKNGSFMLSEGDILSLYFRDEFFEKDTPEIQSGARLAVVYEDENIIIANKPRGLVVHADDKGTKDTLISRILGYLYERGEYDPSKEQSFVPALCNRLDRNTEGLVIAAKTAAALRIINSKIKSREIKKYYRCITENIPKKSADTLVSYLSRGDKRVSVSAGGSGKEIKTKYRIIASDGKRALLEVELLTGRTHQIRAQLAAIGCPLEGDIKYGARSSKKPYMLCSCKIKFDFKTGAGELGYLGGKTIEIDSGYKL